MNSIWFKIGVLFWAITCLSATCNVSMKNTSIRPEISTYFIKTFTTTATSAPPTLGQQFSEELKDKIQRESRLTYADVNPDIEFEGTLQSFNISAVAPQNGEITQFSRLTIVVRVQYYDNQDEDENWEQNFSFFLDYDASQNLLDIQDDLVDEIFAQLLQDVFNKAFSSW